jgi:hypothetical protein
MVVVTPDFVGKPNIKKGTETKPATETKKTSKPKK